MKILRWKWFWLVGLAGILLFLSFFWVSKPDKESPRPLEPAVTADLLTLSFREIPVPREATGFVIPETRAALASRITALVEEIRVREGDRVRTGDLLIVLDSRDLRARLQRAEADLANAEIHMERVKRLFADESASRRNLDDAEQAYQAAEAAKKGAEADLAYTAVLAPFPGIITEKLAETGELTTPGQPLLRMEDVRRMQLQVTVSESEIGALPLGKKVSVSLDALADREIPGRVALILPSADPAIHSFTVKVDLPPHPGLAGGLFGRLLFTAGSRKTLLLPPSAVLERNGLQYAFAVTRDGILRIRLISRGGHYGNQVEILSGLEPGERVLVDASRGREGARVRPPEGNGS
ncbi:MAG: efflux RND transporter periplasmic adaptor subunit [Nitrospirae bacterium]|nr:efflux RND transporter periplasmic adaptor subunit [Nitrospirota bacterium]